MAAKHKTISIDVNVGSQDVTYREILEAHGHKCKIEIKRDSYDFQSHARAYVWQKDKLEWSLVDTIHYSAIKVQRDLHVLARIGRAREVNAAQFRTDRDTLLVKLSNVLA